MKLVLAPATEMRHQKSSGESCAYGFNLPALSTSTITANGSKEPRFAVSGGLSRNIKGIGPTPPTLWVLPEPIRMRGAKAHRNSRYQIAIGGLHHRHLTPGGWTWGDCLGQPV